MKKASYLLILCILLVSMSTKALAGAVYNQRDLINQFEKFSPMVEENRTAFGLDDKEYIQEIQFGSMDPNHALSENWSEPTPEKLFEISGYISPVFINQKVIGSAFLEKTDQDELFYLNGLSDNPQFIDQIELLKQKFTDQSQPAEYIFDGASGIYGLFNKDELVVASPQRVLKLEENKPIKLSELCEKLQDFKTRAGM